MAEVFSGDVVTSHTRQWLGTPYKHQHSTMGVACDCLGLVRGVWRSLNGSEPRMMPNYSSSWDEGHHGEILLNTAQEFFVQTASPSAGDVLIFRMFRGSVAKHCGIMVSDTTFIHATRGVGVVHEVELTKDWQRRIVFSGAFPKG